MKYILKIDGMRCSMCESHMNDLIRKNWPVKKVKSSHRKNQTSFDCDVKIDEKELREKIEMTGYRVLSVAIEEE